MSHASPARRRLLASSAAKVRSGEATVTCAPRRTASPACAGPPRHATGRSPSALEHELGSAACRPVPSRPFDSTSTPRSGGNPVLERSRARPAATATGPPCRAGRRPSKRRSSTVTTLDAVRELDAGKVGAVGAAEAELARLLGRAAAELDGGPGAGQQRRDGGAPAAGADHDGVADRLQAAEPLPLQRDARPHAVGDLLRGRLAGLAVERAGEAQRAAAADGHAARADAPAPADVLGADDRDRDDRRAGLERQPPDAALGLAERARGARACPRGRCRPRRPARG